MSKKRKLLYGVGVNDADYVVEIKEHQGYVNGKQKQRRIWVCPFYRVWGNMLHRGYSDKWKNKHPTYEDCAVCDEWLIFSKFRAWMETQDWEGKQLDKDILVSGNKLYHPAACIFVSGILNKFITERHNDRGEWPIGVSWHKASNRFIANCSNPFTGERGYIGLFVNPEEAHQAWLERKLELAYELAALQTDERVAKALIERYERYCSQREGV